MKKKKPQVARKPRLPEKARTRLKSGGVHQDKKKAHNRKKAKEHLRQAKDYVVE